MPKKKCAAVAMSGGVDSSYAAYLLKESGYDIFGVTMNLFEQNAPETSAADICKFLGISHYFIDMRSQFNNIIIDDYTNGYCMGMTPNPCVKCNMYLKFGSLLEKSKLLGADYLATGHYAQIISDTNGVKRLCKGYDEEKDQSYFLYGLGNERIQEVLFPLGALQKSQVKQRVKELGFPAVIKPESKDACFLQGTHRSFIENKFFASAAPGNFIYHGKTVGIHKGIPFYTIGQRRGISVSIGRPVYIHHINKNTNEIHLGDRDDLYRESFNVKQLIILAPDLLDKNEFTVKIRYRAESKPCKIHWSADKNTIRVSIDQCSPFWGVTPGQSAVFFYDNIVIAGGIIDETKPL